MLRLDYVSPLPPTRTGIADYSADLLPHLAARSDLRLVALPGQEVSAELRARWPTVGPEALGGERTPLYHMGNNHMHGEVWKAAMRVPGVLVLHDLVLHHFLLDRTLGRRDFSGYRDQLADDHGWVGAIAAVPVRWSIVSNSLQFSMPARRALLRAQRGVLVHGRFAVEELRAEDPDLRVRAVPMAVPLPPRIDRAAGAALRQRLAIPDAAPVLGSYGFQTPGKRTAVAIRALARPELAGVHLIVAGEESPYTNLRGEADKAGVAGRVHILGYVPFAQLEEAIAASDLCLNLRYPTAGETSASLLRILAGGRPAIVSEFAQFRDLPDGAVVKVPLHHEDEEGALAGELAALLAAPEALRAMGERAREHVAREHDPARAAAAMLAASEEFAALEPPGPAPVRAPLPSNVMRDELDGEILIDNLDGWVEGERRELRVRLRNTGNTRWLASGRERGGVTVWVELLAGREPVESPPWWDLPRDLEPGDEWSFTVTLRRPPGPAILKVVPRLVGMGDAYHYGGPLYEEAL